LTPDAARALLDAIPGAPERVAARVRALYHLALEVADVRAAAGTIRATPPEAAALAREISKRARELIADALLQDHQGGVATASIVPPAPAPRAPDDLEISRDPREEGGR
jgi:hypothetical protein